MQAERHRVINERFARTHHQVADDDHGFVVIGEGHARPFVGDFFGGQFRIPSEPSERIPVRLREMMPAPIRVQSWIRHGNHSRDVARLNFSRQHLSDSRAAAVRVRV